MEVISTMPPYAPYLRKVAEHAVLSGVRLNTVMPRRRRKKKGLLKKGAASQEDLLRMLKEKVGSKDIWIDLKCRQLRTSHGRFYHGEEPERSFRVGGKVFRLDPSRPRAYGEFFSPPWAALKISHKIDLDTSEPVRCYMNDGLDKAWIVAVEDGDTLIMLDGPKKLVGGGEAINIMHPSLKINGFFTKTDLAYIEAAKRVGIHTFMLSYVEQDSDIEQMLERDPDAKIAAKIESPKGLEWVRDHYAKWRDKGVILMAARGDLYVEVQRPDRIVEALQTIIDADPNAIIASRILGSLRKQYPPTCADIMDVECLLRMGYKTFMVGDELCFDEDVILLALDMLESMYEGREP